MVYKYNRIFLDGKCVRAMDMLIP